MKHCVSRSDSVQVYVCMWLKRHDLGGFIVNITKLISTNKKRLLVASSDFKQ